MGTGLVASLRTAGYQVAVWNRTPARMQRAVELGAVAFDSATAAVDCAQVVFLSLTSSEVSAEVLVQVDRAVSDDQLIVDMTTMSPHDSRRLAAGRGDRYITCPVFATPGQFGRGAATLLTGGTAAESELLTELWPSIGTRRHLGADHGRASALKLLTNYLHLTAIAQIGSALVTGREWGLDDEILLDWFGANPAVPQSVRPRIASMLAGGREQGFAQADAAHALQMALDGAVVSATKLIGAAEAAETYTAAQRPGTDISSVVNTIARSTDD